jgi:hypothetical protein
MTGPLGDVQAIQAAIAGYTPEQIAEDYPDMFWTIVEALVAITTLPLAKMIDHAEGLILRAEQQRMVMTGQAYGRLGPMNLDAGKVQVSRQVAILRKLLPIQEDFLKES